MLYMFWKFTRPAFRRIKVLSVTKKQSFLPSGNLMRLFELKSRDSSMVSSAHSQNSSGSTLIEDQNNTDLLELELVVKNMWGDEESELRQNIFTSFVKELQPQLQSVDNSSFLETIEENSNEGRSTGLWQKDDVIEI